MTNPVSQSPSAQLPVAGSQLIDPASGMATGLFQRFLAGLYLRTGGAVGTDSGDISQTATNALSTANDANQAATLAQTTASAAQVSALEADATANTALSGVNSCVTTIQALRVSSLQTQNNLSDVANRNISRANLGVNVYPITATFDALTNNLQRYIPIVVPAQLPANFLGSVVFWGVPPTSDAVFTISVIRGSVVTVIGTILIIHGGAGIILSPQAAVNLGFADVLVIGCPTPRDTTLAEVAITIPLTIS